jgi:hypothetical protein
MELHGPPVRRHPVQVLTPSIQCDGQLEIVGNPIDFLNDSTRDALILHEASLGSIPPTGPVKGLSRSRVSVRKQEVVFLHFAEPEAILSQIRLLTREELMIAYTPLAILRGAFHLPAEISLNDFLATLPNSFLPITQASLFMLAELPSPFPQRCELLVIGRPHIWLYHTA